MVSRPEWTVLSYILSCRPALTNNGCCAKEEDEEGVIMDKESF